MSLPIGAISMYDISAAYGRGATGSSGFQNFYAYSLGEYYRGGQYVPLYDPGGPYGAEPQNTSSNVNMNVMRGSGGYTFYTVISNQSNGSKFPSYGYATPGDGNFGVSTDTASNNFKCYGAQVSGFYYNPLAASLYLRIYGNFSNSGWYSLQIVGATAGDTTNYTYLASAASVAPLTSSNTGVAVTQWAWSVSGYNPLPVLGNQYIIRVRRTSTY